MEVGMSAGHIVLDGDPAPHPQKGAHSPFFGPCLLWPNGWMDHDGTWNGGRPRPRPQCIRLGPRSPWGPSSLQLKRSTAPRALLAHVYCGQTAGWIKMPLGTKVGLDPRHIVLHGDLAPPGKGARPPFPPIFGPCLL